MERNELFAKTRIFADAYEAICKPYCEEIGISVQAFEILMAIARGKGTATANNICKHQNIKPTLMSFHIEKLVQMGLVERQPIEGNRRSINLVCTDKAMPVLLKGWELYKRYTALLWEGIGEDEVEQLKSTFAKIYANAEKIIKG